MNKIKLIIAREYLTRVKKLSFIVMTFLSPILFAALFVVPIWMAKYSESQKIVTIVDETGIFQNQMENTDQFTFSYESNIDTANEHLKKGNYDIVVYIPKPSFTIPSQAAVYYADKSPGMASVSALQKQLESVLRDKILLEAHNISADDYRMITSTKMNLNVENVNTGEESNTGFKSILGIVFGLIIYFCVFFFGSQIMRGVIEEKSSRIVEVIISSVKPFQLLMGKVIGIALVGLTQFTLWIVLTLGLVTAASVAFSPQSIVEAGKMSVEMKSNQNETLGINAGPQLDAQSMELYAKAMDNFQSVNWTLMIVIFLVYFLGGYLLYASLFAAIGSMVDNEADTSQFMLPITVPLLVAILAFQVVIENPDGALAFWLSIIPFTSPIVMMMRIPFGVPIWEITLSLGLLIAGFIFTTWLAARIYRIGILMYGKKITYGEVRKWLRY